MSRHTNKLLALPMSVACLCLSAGAAALTRAEAEAIVNDPDRTPDAQLDERRAPVDLLMFMGIERGMRVADLDTGGGWTTELIARAVGPDGRVYTRTGGRVSPALSERLNKPALSHVVAFERDFPAEARNLDVIVVLFAYHHVIGQPEEARMAEYGNVLNALKPGGAFIVVDTQAPDEAGPESGRTTHRASPALQRRQLEAAGFVFDASGDFIQNPNDPLTVSGREVEGTASAFVHRYLKPE